MKKVLAFTLTLLLALTFALGFGAATLAQGELQNASFEEVGADGLPANWTTYDWNQRTPADGKAATFTLMTDSGAKDGKNYMKITAPDPNDARLRGSMQLEANTIYKVSVWAKAEGVPEDAACGANISLDAAPATSKDIKGTSTDWQQIVFYIGKSEVTNPTLTLGIGTYGKASKGTVYFDGVTVEKVTEIPAGADSFVPGSNNPVSGTTDSGMSPVLIIVLIVVALIIVGGIIFVSYKGFKNKILNEESTQVSSEKATEEISDEKDKDDDDDDEDSML